MGNFANLQESILRIFRRGRPPDTETAPKPTPEFLAACREYAEVMADARPDEEEEPEPECRDDESWFDADIGDK